MRLSLHERSSLALACIIIGCLGLIARVLLAALSIGCDDAGIWLQHAETLRVHGMQYALTVQEPGRWHYNHPPLMGYWALLSLHMSGGDPAGFSHWMKTPGLLGELATSLLVYRIWQARDPRRAAFAFAAYGTSLPLILVSGYHCNTECAYLAFALLAFFLMHEKRRPFWSGLALAASLNVKLMPIFLIPPLLAQCRSWRAFWQFAAGGSLAVLPFVPFLLRGATGMYRNMLAYNSLQLDWGLMAFLNHAVVTPPFGTSLSGLREFAIQTNRYWILLGVVAVSALAWARDSQRPYELGALAWSLFLILTPGFGVQYAVSVLPLLFVSNIKSAVEYSLTAGLMMLVVYTYRMAFTFPLRALVQYFPFPPLAMVLGVVAWIALIRFAVRATWTLAANPPASGQVDPLGAGAP